MTFIPGPSYYGNQLQTGLADVERMFVKPELDVPYLQLVGEWRIATLLKHDTREYDTEARQTLNDIGLSMKDMHRRARWVHLDMEVWRAGVMFTHCRSHAIIMVDDWPSIPVLRKTYDELLERAMAESGSKLKQLLESVGIVEVLMVVHGV